MRLNKLDIEKVGKQKILNKVKTDWKMLLWCKSLDII